MMQVTTRFSNTFLHLFALSSYIMQLPVEDDWDLSDFDMDEDVDTKDEL